MRAGRYSLGVTLRTPGDDEELVAGFLFTEGVISRREQLVALRMPGENDAERNLVRVTLDSKQHLKARNSARRFSAGSACGVCGKASIAQPRRRGLRRPEAATLFDPEILCQLPEKLRAAQVVFGRTGGLHAAPLFNAGGELLVLREDIGRHNAVDKVIGWAFLQGRLHLSGQVLLVSGRGGFGIGAFESRRTTRARAWFDALGFFARSTVRNLLGTGADRSFCSRARRRIRTALKPRRK